MHTYTMMSPNYKYMTRFAKACVVHTFDFAHLGIHKIHWEWNTT